MVATLLCLVGCRTTYHVVTAPVRIFHHPHDEPATSDVVTPGTPVAPPPSPTPLTRRVVERNTTASSPTPRRVATQPSPKPSASSRGESAPVSFPTAKSVPDKPGYVFSPSDPTKYVDVTGYPSGSKVKDPYSGKIFLVP
jgi:hypothetical protein